MSSHKSKLPSLERELTSRKNVLTLNFTRRTIFPSRKVLAPKKMCHASILEPKKIYPTFFLCDDKSFCRAKLSFAMTTVVTQDFAPNNKIRCFLSTFSATVMYSFAKILVIAQVFGAKKKTLVFLPNFARRRSFLSH